MSFFLQLFGTNITGHDDDGIGEVNAPTFGVGNIAVFEYLQEHIKDIGVSFFYFVEQYQAIGLATDFVGQLAAIIVTDVSGRSTHQSRNIMMLAKF